MVDVGGAGFQHGRVFIYHLSFLKVLPVVRSGHMITFTLQNGFVATLRTSGTEPKIKCYAEYCAAPGNRSADASVGR